MPNVFTPVASRLRWGCLLLEMWLEPELWLVFCDACLRVVVAPLVSKRWRTSARSANRAVWGALVAAQAQQLQQWPVKLNTSEKPSPNH